MYIIYILILMLIGILKHTQCSRFLKGVHDDTRQYSIWLCYIYHEASETNK